MWAEPLFVCRPSPRFPYSDTWRHGGRPCRPGAPEAVPAGPASRGSGGRVPGAGRRAHCSGACAACAPHVRAGHAYEQQLRPRFSALVTFPCIDLRRVPAWGVTRAGAGEPGAARHGIRVSSGGQGAGGAQGWPDAWTGDDQASGGGGGRRDHALGGVEGDEITRSVGVAGDGTTRSVGVGDVATRRSVARRGGGRAEVGAADPPAPSAPTSLCAAPLAPERPPGRRRISCPEGPDTRMTSRRPGPLHDFAKL